MPDVRQDSRSGRIGVSVEEMDLVRCAPAVTWVKDRSHIVVVDERRCCSWKLEGLEAAVWDLWALGYDYDGLCCMVADLVPCSRPAAVATLEAILARWMEAGLIVGQAELDHG